MAKRTRLKSQAAPHPVPQTMTEANDFIHRIGAAQRERDRIQAEMNDRLAEIKAEFEEQAQPFKTEIEERTIGVLTFCEANRDELTRNGKVKFHKFPAGEVNWRRRPPKVTVRGMALVIERLKALKLTRFLRVKEEVNKEAMLAEPDIANSVDGVNIGSEGEDFVITPFETDLEEVA
ncbi:MAG: host-nuclease inhibitor Gam family protein [Alphaproteobacteria bacterium]|nr:host-nuclease inhibitor Gam family protein [Alphaproteobacteria bacterium]